jgi:GDSL-like Lipase/Acylhydrolase family
LIRATSRTRRVTATGFCIAALALTAALLALIRVPPAVAASPSSVVIPFGDSGWKWANVAPGGAPGFEQPQYDDSTWSTGQAGFGQTDNRCSWNNTAQVKTLWIPQSDLLVRHHFTVTPAIQTLHLSGDVDNDAHIYVNGVDIADPTSGYCDSGAIDVDIPANVLTVGDNVLAIRATDYGGSNFLDVQLSYTFAPKKVAVMAALGDSYSSGEGANHGYICGTDLATGKYWSETNVPYTQKTGGSGFCYTNTGTSIPSSKVFRDSANATASYQNLCHVYPQAYGYLIASALGVAPVNLLFDACSGAVAGNIGFVDCSKVKCGPQYPKSPDSLPGKRLQSTDLSSFVTAQLARPDLITIGVGGNDIFFSAIVKKCIESVCNTKSYWQGVVKNVQTAFPTWVDLFRNLKSRYGDTATIVDFGYPRVVSPLDDVCDSAFGIDVGEQGLVLYGILTYLNQALATAAQDAGIVFLDPTQVTPLDGHGVCSAQPYFRGLTGRGPNARGLIGNESFHPKPIYHAVLAACFSQTYVVNGLLALGNPVATPTLLPPAPDVTYWLRGSSTFESGSMPAVPAIDGWGSSCT